MKYLVLLFVTITIGFSACNKEAEINKIVEEGYLSSGMYNVSLDPLGWLIFTDRNHIISVIDDLEISNDNYDLQYEPCLNQIGDDLTYEQEQSAIAQCGYIEDKPAKDFVNSFGSGYSCIYDKMETEIDNWVNQQTSPINFSNMPTHVFDDPIIGSVYNEYGEVQVGNIVYFTKANGKQIGISRDQLNYEIVQNLRTLFANPNFDPTSYPSTPVTSDSLKEAFLFGEQIGSSNTNSKGDFYNVLQATVTIVAAPIVFLYDLEKWNYSPGSGCYLAKKYDPASWVGSNRQMNLTLQLSNTNVIGQWVKAQSRCYDLNNKKRLGKMKVDGDCASWDTDQHISCTTQIDLHTVIQKEKKKKKLTRRLAVGLYSGHSVHENTTTDKFFYCDYYLNGDLKKTIK